jgi:aerobic-type carbon monoxide dehydrogenase small subunit (CoxS/CutS family)
VFNREVNNVLNYLKENRTLLNRLGDRVSANQKRLDTQLQCSTEIQLNLAQASTDLQLLTSRIEKELETIEHFKDDFNELKHFKDDFNELKHFKDDFNELKHYQKRLWSRAWNRKES